MGNIQPTIDSKEHNASARAKRVTSVDPFGGAITDGNYTTYIDEPDVNTTYIGIAQIGEATSSASWQIQKIVLSGDVTSTTWAGGSDAFTNIWDNRAALSYS